jgi:hypothetical protein
MQQLELTNHMHTSQMSKVAATIVEEELELAATIF